MQNLTLPNNPFSAIIIGRRASGRSTLALDLVSRSGADYIAIVPSEACDLLYPSCKRVVEGACTGYVLEEHLQRNKGNRTTILDNCILEPEVFDRVCMAMKENKHTVIDTEKQNIILVTSYMSKHIECEAVDYVCLFAEPDQGMRRNCFMQFAKDYMSSQDEFDAAMDRLEKYECLLFDTKEKTYKVYRCRATNSC